MHEWQLRDDEPSTMLIANWPLFLIIFGVVNISYAYLFPPKVANSKPAVIAPSANRLRSFRFRLGLLQEDKPETTDKSAVDTGMYDGSDVWIDNYGGFGGFDIDWELEKARRIIEGPSFAPLRMTLWQPPEIFGTRKSKPGFADNAKIFLNNALQLVGLAESFDGAPLVQGISSYNGTIGAFLSRVIDGNLVELAGGPLFLMLQGYYKQYGPIFKLTFGPKSFMIISDPVMARHILKENPWNYDKGILAEILEPVMGKGLIPADLETWKVRRKAIVPGFHKAWLNAMVSHYLNENPSNQNYSDFCTFTSLHFSSDETFRALQRSSYR